MATVSDVMHFGLLNIDKPTGVTSRAVVNQVARLVRPDKAGHAGTLDPLASGVLIVCVGRATRLIADIQTQRKTYRGRFVLGRQSDTDDVTGHVEVVTHCVNIRRDQIEELIPRFLGTIQQVPPRFSAVHVNGKRAYELARRGQDVELAPKSVDVFRIQVIDFADSELELEIECGSGTYIRSIGRDLGNLLGCGAVMSALVRTRIGPFDRADGVTLDALNGQSLNRHMLPAVDATRHLPNHQCSAAQLTELRHGRSIVQSLPVPDGARVAMLTPDGVLAAMARYCESDTSLAPKQVFL